LGTEELCSAIFALLYQKVLLASVKRMRKNRPRVRSQTSSLRVSFVTREKICELHDAISQDLFSLRMATGGLQAALAPCSQALELQPYIETLQEATTRMIREMRALLLELRPGQLEQLGLAAALEELAMAYRTRLSITVTTSFTPVQLDAKAEHALLRIAQEAFTNAVRHADATTMTLCLRPLPHAVEFIITDDGKGFEVAELEAQHGLGLRLMKERAQELHGTFSLSTTPGGGTRIHICSPQENLDD
jgi:signal transduction histidine kinase